MAANPVIFSTVDNQMEDSAGMETDEGDMKSIAIKFMYYALLFGLIINDIYATLIIYVFRPKRVRNKKTYYSELIQFVIIALIGMLLLINKKFLVEFIAMQIFNTTMFFMMLYFFWDTKNIPTSVIVILNILSSIIKWKYGGMHAIMILIGKFFRLFGVEVRDI